MILMSKWVNNYLSHFTFHSQSRVFKPSQIRARHQERSSKGSSGDGTVEIELLCSWIIAHWASESWLPSRGPWRTKHLYPLLPISHGSTLDCEMCLPVFMGFINYALCLWSGMNLDVLLLPSVLSCFVSLYFHWSSAGRFASPQVWSCAFQLQRVYERDRE